MLGVDQGRQVLINLSGDCSCAAAGPGFGVRIGHWECGRGVLQRLPNACLGPAKIATGPRAHGPTPAAARTLARAFTGRAPSFSRIHALLAYGLKPAVTRTATGPKPQPLPTRLAAPPSCAQANSCHRPLRNAVPTPVLNTHASNRRVHAAQPPAVRPPRRQRSRDAFPARRRGEAPSPPAGQPYLAGSTGQLLPNFRHVWLSASGRRRVQGPRRRPSRQVTFVADVGSQV
jgi:hypothetical protein